MTLNEMELEFRFKYDSASNGGPDLNIYEISLCLTQSAKDILNSSYLTYETSEISRRLINPFLVNETYNNISSIDDKFTNFKTYEITLDFNYLYRIRDRVKLKNCIDNPKVLVIRKDNLQEYLNNPFKRPNKRQVLREDVNDKIIKIYSDIELESYEISYLKKDSPIIIKDLSSDPNLMGDESIEGLTTESQTLIADIYHDRIIDRAVQLAILYTRENGLRNQISV